MPCAVVYVIAVKLCHKLFNLLLNWIEMMKEHPYVLLMTSEVARTRMREECTRYHHFWQTLHAVVQERGALGLYRGLAIQLMRQIPSTGIMMATYELVLYVYATHSHRI